MAKSPDDKPKEVLEAERHGGQTFDPTAELKNSELNCPDCGGTGLRADGRICQTCEGSGKAN